jgi:alkanesulfonate monooxygenase SsuD/methylene tetrahydromethanopterin reductase-like flavin-dependent oxidoreductase (luciferase family)
VSTTRTVSVTFPREHPAPAVVEIARRAEAAGLDRLWVIEDCFYTAGVSLAAAALASTESLGVGIGILPAVARNPAVTAMEIATLAALAPGRFTAGIGHGVQEWMEQMGARPASALTALEETITAVRRLLRGERVDFEGATVSMRGVRLDAPPDPVPPVLAGVRQPRSLALAGRVADGVVLAEGTGPAAVRSAREAAGRADDPGFRVTVFTPLCMLDDTAAAQREMVGFVRSLVESHNPALQAHPQLDRVLDAVAAGDEDIARLPPEVWRELGAIGDLDAVVAHVDALHEAGADDVALFLAPDDLGLAVSQIEHAAIVRRALLHQ